MKVIYKIMDLKVIAASIAKLEYFIKVQKTEKEVAANKKEMARLKTEFNTVLSQIKPFHQ